MSKKSNIQVAVRIRPPLPREIQDNKFVKCIVAKDEKLYISLDDKPIVISQEELEKNPKLNQFTFDKVFDVDSTQEQIYKDLVKPNIKTFIQDGINTTIFAYGQTGSGKTYTVQGDVQNDLDPKKSGIIQRSAKQIFKELKKYEKSENECEIIEKQIQQQDDDISDNDTDISEINEQNQVFVSIYQIYNENVNDLLSQNVSQNLKIRQDSQKNVFVENITNKEVTSAKQLLKFLRIAQENRTSHGTNLNEMSSRSHLIMTVTVNIIDIRDQSLISSKLNFVDLAGSERVKDSNVGGQQLIEACYINKSLFSLSGVVDALQKNKKANYRESKLTYLLSDSLGGNCKTTLIAMVSPSFDFCNESNNTLNFAHSCKKIQNIIKQNKYKGSIPASTPVKLKKKTIKQQVPWQQIKPQIQQFFLKIEPFGKINVIKCGDENWTNKVLYLHGAPSSVEECFHQIPVFLHLKYQFFAFDFPGFGNSQGKQQLTRSENVLDQNGPSYVVNEIIKQLKLEKPVILGYDWGAGIALKMAINQQKLFSKIICFHPSYNEQKTDEIKNIKIPTLIQWCKQDQFHPWKKFQILARKIPKVTIDLFEIKMFKHEYSHCSYESQSNLVTIPIYSFLSGTDYNQNIQVAYKAQEEQSKNTKGQNIVSLNNVMLQENLTQEDIQKITDKPDIQKDAIKLFKTFDINDVIQSRLNTSHPMRAKYKLIVQQISLSLKNLQNEQYLIQNQILENMPNNYEYMLNSSRYFKGRQILVKGYVQQIQPSQQNYLILQQKQNQEKYVSHKAIIDSIDEQFIYVDNSQNEILKFEHKEIMLLNQPHIFSKDIINNLVFEDGLKCDYESTDVKIKIIQIFQKIQPLINQLDFKKDPLPIQLKCVRAIRSCLDYTTFDIGNEKKVDQKRHKVGQIGKLALFGQGNCHGCSSVMASFLLPFSKLLGIDVKYRGGFSFSQADENISNTIERHQWLELTFRPSMQTFICDLFKEGVHQNQDYLTLPIKEAYDNHMYPNGNLIINTIIQQ